jgi:NADPH:quinone reductase
MARNAGARVIAISRRKFALHIAEQFGADQCLLLDDAAEAAAAALQSTSERGFDCVIEAVGRQETLDLATELTKERGRLVIAGYHQDGRRQINLQLWNWRGLDVINAHERDSQTYVRGMEAATQAVLAGQLDPGPLYTHIYPLEDLPRALEMARNRPEGFLKALVIP